MNKQQARKMEICRVCVRHVSSCSKCLHFQECLNSGVVASGEARYIAHVAVDLLPMVMAAMAEEYGKRGLPVVSIKRAPMPDYDKGFIAVLCVAVPYRCVKKLFRKPLMGNEEFETIFDYVSRVFTFVKRKELN